MSVEVHIDWAAQTRLVGIIHSATRSPTVTFEYAPAWLASQNAFAIDPTALPLRRGPAEDDAPLVIDADGVEAAEAAEQGLQAVVSKHIKPSSQSHGELAGGCADYARGFFCYGSFCSKQAAEA